jgi:signal transduction histidine kinase
MLPPEGDAARPTSEVEALRRMHRITADHERSFEDKLRALLDLGCSYLGVDIGFLTEISEGEQVIVAASGDHDPLQPGASCPLSEAYCRKTIDLEGALTVQHAAIEGWEADAAYDRFGLESYIGAKVVVDGEVDGTFCFADTEPRDEPFTEDEETVVELMAEWASYERFRQRATARIERQRDRLERFASVVSHDLRNPLGAVRGYLDLAEETGEAEHFDRCRDGLDRMESLIDDLLALARQGDEVTEPEPVALAELADRCWSLVATGDATLRVDTDRVVDGDPGRLRQLFENLFRNAVEHGSTGSRPQADDSVEHGSTSSRAEPGDSVEHGSTGSRPQADDAVEHGDPDVTVTVGDMDGGFYVADDGPGIPADERDRVFEEGYSSENDGTGFGLAIVRQVADAHGWTVAVTESADGGARFEFTGVDGTPAADVRPSSGDE